MNSFAYRLLPVLAAVCFLLSPLTVTVTGARAKEAFTPTAATAGILEEAGGEALWTVTAPYMEFIDITLGDESFLPATVTAELYRGENETRTEAFGYTLVSCEYYFLDNTVTDFELPGGVFIPDRPGDYYLEAELMIPPEYNIDEYWSRLDFTFLVNVAGTETDWAFSIGAFHVIDADTGMTPEQWPLAKEVRCEIVDRSLLKMPLVLDNQPAVWNLSGATSTKPDRNGEYEVTVPGRIVLSLPGDFLAANPGFDLNAVDGVEDGAVAVAQTVAVSNSDMPLGFVKPLTNRPNPELGISWQGPYVVFYVKEMPPERQDKLRVWFTEDGRNYDDVMEEVWMGAGLMFTGLSPDTWYGVYLELEGEHPFDTVTETVYFRFGADLKPESLIGDRGGAGRNPFFPVTARPPAPAVTGRENGSGDSPSRDGVESGSGDSPSRDGGKSGSGYSPSRDVGGSGSGDSPSRYVGDDPGSYCGHDPEPEAAPVSGGALAALAAVYPDAIPFACGGAKIHIPTEYIASLGLSPTDGLSVRFSAVGPGRWRLSLSLNGAEAVYTGQRPITVTAPLPPGSPTGANLVIWDASGRLLPLSYCGEDGVAVIKTVSAGIFHVAQGKPAAYSDVSCEYVDFLFARGLLSREPRFYPGRAAGVAWLRDMLGRLTGGEVPGSATNGGYVTYSAAADMIAQALRQAGTARDSGRLLTLLDVEPGALLSRYGCAKLLALAVRQP